MPLKDIKLFLFDLDGTLNLGDKLFDFTPSLLREIERQGKHYAFVTNNSSRSQKDYAKKWEKMGFSVSEETFYTPTQVTISYLKETAPQGLFYAIGTRSFCRELKKAGLSFTTRYNKKALGVVQGYDTELNYRKIDTACRLLFEDKNRFYLATNPDLACPTSYGFVPDCGSACQMVTNATGRTPSFMGKPEPRILFLAMKHFGVTPKETLMVGDRLYTDIQSGINANCETLVVLTGEATAETAKASSATYVMKDCSILLEELKKL